MRRPPLRPQLRRRRRPRPRPASNDVSPPIARNGSGWLCAPARALQARDRFGSRLRGQRLDRRFHHRFRSRRGRRRIRDFRQRHRRWDHVRAAFRIDEFVAAVFTAIEERSHCRRHACRRFEGDGRFVGHRRADVRDGGTSWLANSAVVAEHLQDIPAGLGIGQLVAVGPGRERDAGDLHRPRMSDRPACRRFQSHHSRVPVSPRRATPRAPPQTRRVRAYIPPNRRMHFFCLGWRARSIERPDSIGLPIRDLDANSVTHSKKSTRATVISIRTRKCRPP